MLEFFGDPRVHFVLRPPSSHGSTRLHQTDSRAVHCPASGLLGAHGVSWRARLNAGCQLPAKGCVG